MNNFDTYYAGTQKGFDRRTKGGFVYFISPLIEETGLVKHCFTARKNGVSPAPYNSLNFSAKREQNTENILKNYEIVARHFGLNVQNFVVDNYAHSYRAIHVTKEDQTKGLPGRASLPLSDGLATQNCSTTLVTLHADCLPLYFLDKKRKAVALCHAGWKGLFSHIVVKTADLMREQFGSEPEDIIAAVGPGIGPCCFEVQQNVYTLFEKEFSNAVVLQQNGKMYADLWKAAVMDMQSVGIPSQNISVAQLCTSCDREHFFSHRRDEGKTGAMLAFIQLH